MTTPVAFGRHVAAPGDTFKGNVKVVEFGLFGGSTYACPTAGASASAAVNIAVASFMEKPPVSSRRVSPRTPRSLRGFALVVTDKQPHTQCCGVYFRNCCKLFSDLLQNEGGWKPEHFLALRFPSKSYFPEPSCLTLENSLRGLEYGEYNSFLRPMQEEFLEFNSKQIFQSD